MSKGVFLSYLFLSLSIQPGEESQFEIISSDELSDDNESDEEEGDEEERTDQIQRRVRVKTLRLESDFYGLYSLKFRVLEGSLVSEGEIAEDFGAFGSVVDIWGAGFVEQESFDSEVFVRFEKFPVIKRWIQHSSPSLGLTDTLIFSCV